MWAEVTYIDNRPTIEANFGLPAGFTLDDLATLPSNTDYLSVIRGLWYLYFTGPTLFNIRAGTQILLGLPYAEVDGVIAEIRNDFTSTTGRLLVTDATEAAIVRSYTFPAELPLEVNPATGEKYKVGDSVKQFAPLVTGVEVIDYIKNPKWFDGYMNQGVFLEVDKFFRFMVRIASPTFSLSTLVYVKSFINRIKPTYTYPMYIVQLAQAPTTVDVTDSMLLHGNLRLNDWIGAFNFDGGPFGMIGGNYDDPHAAFGGAKQAFDSDGYVHGNTAVAPPTFPIAAAPIHWGFDRGHLTPSDVIIGLLSMTHASAFHVTYDGLFQMDMPAFDTLFGVFSRTEINLPAIPPHTTPLILGPAQTVGGSGGILNEAIFITRGMYPFLAATPILIDIVVNGTTVLTIPLTIPAGYDYVTPLPLSAFNLLPGDTVEVHIYKSGSDVPMPGGTRFFVALGHGSVWAFDTLLPAGTYYSPRLM
jgi:hypothetical protein